MQDIIKKMLIAAILSVTMILFATLADAAVTLLHQYDFQNGVTDLVGSANGTLINGATVSGGKLTLDGTDDYAQFATWIVPFTGSYSVALRAQEITHPNNSYVELISQGVGSWTSFYLGYNTGGTIRLTDNFGTGVLFPTDGKYHMYVAVVDADSNTSKLYIDGELRATKGSAITSSASSTGGYTRLGQQFSNIYDEYFAGNIDDVSIYSGALIASEVGNLNNTPVPEPGTMMLLGSGLVGLAGYGRRLFKK